ncbi:MAG: hypothetical protein ACPIE8_06365 [Henriciella sp.]
MKNQSMGVECIITAFTEHHIPSQDKNKKQKLARIELFDGNNYGQGDFIAKCSRLHSALADSLADYPDGIVTIETTFKEDYVNG